MAGKTASNAHRQRELHRLRPTTCPPGPGTTRSHANESRLPCRDIARPPGRLLLKPHSPSAAFGTPELPTQAPGNHPGSGRGSCVSHALRLAGHVAIRFWPEGPTAVCAILPNHTPFASGLACATHRLFPGIERRSIPVPTGCGLSQFGTVSRKTYWQALAGLSWLSYSRPLVFPAVPGLVRSGLSGRPAQCSPRQPG